MACHLFGSNPLPKPMMTYYHKSKTGWLTHIPLRDVAVILKVKFSNSFYELISWGRCVKLLSGKCHKTPLIVSIDSGNKPLPEPVLTKISDATRLQCVINDAPVVVLWADCMLGVIQGTSFLISLMAHHPLMTLTQYLTGSIPGNPG